MKRNTLLHCMLLAMLLSMLPFARAAAANEAYAVYFKKSQTLTFYYNGSYSMVSDEKWRLDDYFNGTADRPDWENGDKNVIRTVVFNSSFYSARPKSLKRLFRNLTDLETIEGMEYYLNTSEVTDMSAMFSGCKSLMDLDLSDFDTGKVTDMSNMFYSCSNLEDLNLSGLDARNVNTMLDMFEDCTSLKNLNLSGFKTRNVTDMSAMFCGCKSLEHLDLSGFDTRNVIYMSVMFENCKNLKSLNLSSFDTRNVTKMSEMFTLCESLTSLDLSNFDTGNVKDMGAMFYGCKSLTELDLSNFDTGNVTGFYNTFAYCHELKRLDVSSFDTHNATTMTYMFKECEQLEMLDLSGFNTQKVKNMEEMFCKCKLLKTIYASGDWEFESLDWSNGHPDKDMFLDCFSIVGGNGTTYTPYTNGHEVDQNRFWARIDRKGYPAYFTEKKKAVPYAVLDGDVLRFYYDSNQSFYSNKTVYYLNSGTKNPEWYTDHKCEDITSVVIDPSFKDVQPKTAYRWFAEMTSLTSVSGLEYLNTSMIGNMFGMFYNCRRLTTLDLTGFNTAKVTDMTAMFYNCSQLTTINAGDTWTTEKVTESDNMFLNCTRLVGGSGTAYNSDYTDKGRAHIDGGSANPGYLTKKSPYVVFNSSNGTLTFYCDGNRYGQTNPTYDLNESEMPAWHDVASSVKKVVFDESFAFARPTTTALWFYDMSNMTRYEGLGYLNTSEVTNMFGMFSGCKALTYISIMGLDLRKVTNMTAMFKDCTNLTQLYLKGEHLVNTSTNNMFYNCRSLTRLDLSEFDTYRVTDMENMFNGCSSLEILDVSTLNTANATVMTRMFYGCSKLTSLNLMSFNTQTVEKMAGMFNGCSALTTIYVSGKWSTEAVTTSGNMFSGCTSLVGGMGTTYDANYVDKTYARVDGGTDNPGYLSLMAYVAIEGETLMFCCDENRSSHAVTYDLVTKYAWEDPAWLSDDNIGNVTNVYFTPSFADVRPVTTSKWFYNMQKLQTVTGIEHLNTSRVEDMSSMFYFCKALKAIDVSHFDTRNVKDMYAMFAGCNALESLDVSNFNTEKVTNMAQMFGGCGFRSIDVGNFDTQNVTTMYAMFYGCPNLTVLDLNTFDTKKVSSWDSMFENSNQLKTIFVGKKWSTEGVSSGRWMFRYCYSLVGGAGTTYDDNMTGVTYARIDGGPSNPGYLTLKEAYVTYDSDSSTLTFYCDDKRSERTGTIYDLDNPREWPSRRSVVFDPSFASARPTSTARWFTSSYGLTSIKGLEYLNTSKVTNMWSMFSSCIRLTMLDLSNFDTRKVTDMSFMFSGCSDLTVIYGGEKWSTESVTDAQYMFYNCTSLVGGMGTKYDANNIGTAYAHIDGGAENPGYLTEKKEAYAEYNGTTLTFYYDDMRSMRTGTTYDMNEENYMPLWTTDDVNALEAQEVEFDKSFANARPTNTAYWFYNMKNLETITGLNYLKTSEVTDMRSMFCNCEKLETLDLSGFDTRKVSQTIYMFGGCSTLKTITVGNNWSMANVTLSNNMFSNCQNLVGEMGTTYDANHIDAAYAHVDGGTANPGYLTGKKEAYAVLAQNSLTFYYDSKRSERQGKLFDLNEEGSSPAWHYDPVTGEETGLVEGISTVVFDTSFADARPTTTYGWFSGMTSLQTITGMKEYLNTSKVEDMGFMFADCSSLGSIDVSKFDTRNVKEMYAMFRNCSSLQTLDVTNFNTSRVTNMFCLFEGCSGLKSIDVSHFDTHNVTSFESMFENCYSLKKLDLSAFDTHNVTNMMRMFIECQELSTIIVGDKWTMENVDMENYGSDLMFYDCYKLVGGAGTTYAEWRVDGRYAHIDGGPDDPGYFTAAFIKGDVNLDGQVGIGDIVAITNVMAGIETNSGIVSRADVNGDNQVGIGDIVAVTNIMAGVQ